MLGVEQFGRELLRTGDLDPVYVAIHNAPSVNERTRERLVLAYWCFYHLGLAARLAEIKDPKKFWDAMMEAAVNEHTEGATPPYPRGGERRHYRGAQAVASMASLIAKYKTAEHAIAGFYGYAPGPYSLAEKYNLTFKSVSDHVQQHRGFGEWMAFKVADMGERVLGLDVDFRDCELGIYKDPRQGAAVAYTEWKQPIVLANPDVPAWEFPITDKALKDTVAHFVTRFKNFKAPPRNDRPVNVQEVETIFCKYKSHLKGHYPLGKDTIEVGHGLEGWGDLAQDLKKGLPKWPPNSR